MSGLRHCKPRAPDIRERDIMPRPPDMGTLAALKAVVGAGAWLDTHDDLAPYISDFRHLYQGATPLVLLPRTVDEVAAILSICNRDEIALVPYGGNTSYCGGATPDESGTQIVLALRRLNRIRQLDAANYSMIVEAGCTLAEAQAAAGAQGSAVPLESGIGGHGANRRQLVDQCGRHRGDSLWDDARSGARPRSRVGGRAGHVRTQEPAQGQHRLRRQIPVHRSRRNPRRHYGRILEAVSAAGRYSHRPRRNRLAATGARVAGAHARCCRGPAHDVRADAENRGRAHGEVPRGRRQSARPRHPLVSSHRAHLAQPEAESRGPAGRGASGSRVARHRQRRRDCDLARTGQSDVETARIGAGSAAPLRRKPQA